MRKMKILLVNGSPREHGVTDRALDEFRTVAEKEGVGTDTFWLGCSPVLSCIACGLCKKSGRCFFDDGVNTLARLSEDADGFVFASPVHYAGASGALKCAMGRLFYSSLSALTGKPAVALAVSRRGGNVAALSEIEKFFTFASMPVVSGNYWCILHGTTREEAARDEEGLQTLRIAARNLIFLSRAVALAKKSGVPLPEKEEKIRTSFIR